MNSHGHELEQAGTAEHQVLRAYLEEVDCALEGLACSQPRAAERGEAVARLERGARALAEHFAQEQEAGGFFAEALAAEPRLHARVEQLRCDHPALQDALDALVEDARVAADSQAWASITRRFRAFTEALRRHENAEDGIVAEAFGADIGGQ